MQTLSATASLSGTHAIEGILDGVADAERESRTGVTWQVIGAVCLGAMGNLLEWYDFAIFGIYSQEIGLCFFSGEADRCHAEGGSGEDGGIPESVYSQILFAGGFVVRPLGGMFFGWVSDRSGRAVSLALTIVGMAVPTLTIAALPCKGQIGLAAPILLTVCRLVQGVAAGGELPGALVFAVEQAPVNRQAVFGGLVQATSVGSVLANGVAAILFAVLDPIEICEYGWRYPFLGGGLTALLVCVVRCAGGLKTKTETARASGAEPPKPRKNFCTILGSNLGIILRIVLASGYSLTGYYLLFVWITHYLRTERDINAFASTSLINVIWAGTILLSGLFSDTLAAPLGGMASPFCCRTEGKTRPSSPGTTILLFGCMMLLAALVVFNHLPYLDPSMVPYYQGFLAMTHALAVGALQVWCVLILPDAESRASCLGVGYNLASSIFGGTAPLIATTITAMTGGTQGAGMYLASVTFVSMATIIFADLRRTVAAPPSARAEPNVKAP